MKKKYILISLTILLLFSACKSENTLSSRAFRIATTTSVENSGLLASITPLFEADYDIEIEIVAVGTGQALALGEAGDVDLVLVHAPELEIAFVENGFGVARTEVMYNDFVILGPENDPANIAEAPSGAVAFTLIHDNQSIFISRGDNSGTHFKENQIWSETSFTPSEFEDWYYSVGQGMGSSLVMANELQAYILSDRGTYLSQIENLPNLTILFGGSSAAENPDNNLLNIYSVIPINPKLNNEINFETAELFVKWITSAEIQQLIHDFKFDDFGNPLFFPKSETWLNSQSSYNTYKSYQNNLLQTISVLSLIGI